MGSTTTATDLIERLPYEAWLRCLDFASSDSEDGPLPFLFLSRRWSQTILEEPALWTTIYIGGWSGDEMARIHTFLYLSRGHLLDIILSPPKSNYATDSIEMIISQAQRIQSITALPIHNSPRPGVEFLPVIKRLITSVSSYPQLRRINANEIPLEWAKMITLCPSLQVFRKIPIAPSTPLPSTLQDIAKIGLTSLDEALPLIQKRGLWYLGIDYSSVEDRLDERAWAEHANRLSQGNLGQITCLEVDLKPPGLQILSSIISVLPQLWSLSLTINDNRPTSQPWTPSSLFPDSVTHIRHFSMNWTVFPDAEPLIEDAYIPMFSTTKALDQVDYFNLSTQQCVPKEVIHKLLNSMPRVCKLMLDLGNGTDRWPFSPVILSNVLDLHLFPALISTYLEAPNAIVVSLDDPLDGFVWPLIIQVQKPNQLPNELITSSKRLEEIKPVFFEESIKKRWPMLHKIQLWGEEWCKALMYVDSLQEVYFEYTSTPVLDGFLLDLLRSPKACPNLRLISSRNYPRWELLFEVMRRRNKINLPIKKLNLRAYPAPAILKRLVLLLQGQVDVYTERDIDEVIYKRFNDPENYRACLNCAPLGYNECTPTFNSTRLSEYHLSLEDMDLLQLCSDKIAPPAQFRDTKKWENITTIEEWYETYPYFQQINFEFSCRRVPPFSVDITGSTLDGVSGPGVMGHAV